ncbi:MAG: hypothetical protein R6U91_07790 [Bacillota bacterium]
MNNILIIALVGLGAGVIGTGSGTIIALFINNPSRATLSLILGFAAGAMLYIIFSELIPGAQNSGQSHAGTFGTVFGTISGILLLSVI